MTAPVVERMEEIANATSHGLGLLASLAALPLLVVLAARNGDIWALIGATVFGTSLVSVYSTSTMYHLLRPGDTKQFWRRLDHSAIYLLIAGTYTPFTLGVLRGPLGWALFFIVWGIAIVGIWIKMLHGPRYKKLSTLVYVVLGWLAIVAIEPLIQRVGWGGLAWLLAGGVAYTVGVIFFAVDERVRFGHCVWHFFVLTGSVCHTVAVAFYAIPRTP